MTEMRTQCEKNIEHFVGLLPGLWDVLEVGIAGDVKPGGHAFLFQREGYKTLDIDPQYGSDFVDDICNPVNAPENAFDLVILSNTIEHVAEPFEAIQGAVKLLKHGGYLIVDCPFTYPFHAEDNFKDYWRMTHQGMGHLLTKAGLEVVEVIPGLITSALAMKI